MVSFRNPYLTGIHCFGVRGIKLTLGSAVVVVMVVVLGVFPAAVVFCSHGSSVIFSSD